MILLLSGYFLLLPFSFALSPFSGIDLPLARLGAATLFLVWLARGIFLRPLFLPVGAASFFLLGFLLVATLSFLWAAEPAWAVRKTLFLWSFVPFFFVLTDVFRSSSARQKILIGLFLGAGLTALVGIMQFFLQFVFGVEKLFAYWTGTLLPFFLGENFGAAVAAYPSLLVNLSGETLMRASAFFPDPHMFAYYLGMLAPLALAYALESQGKKRKSFLFLFSLLLLADLLSFSRGAYVGLVLGAGFLAGALIIRSRFALFRKFFLPFLVVLFVVGIGARFTPFAERFLSSFSGTDASVQERFVLWSQALETVRERPLLGVGLGNYPLEVKPSAGLREPIYAHNLYLDIAAETGILGLIFFLGFFGMIMAKLWQRWRKEGRPLFLGLLSALLVFLVHSVFETPLFSVQVLPLLLFLAAFSLTSRRGYDGYDQT